MTAALFAPSALLVDLMNESMSTEQSSSPDVVRESALSHRGLCRSLVIAIGSPADESTNAFQAARSGYSGTVWTLTVTERSASL